MSAKAAPARVGDHRVDPRRLHRRKSAIELVSVIEPGGGTVGGPLPTADPATPPHAVITISPTRESEAVVRTVTPSHTEGEHCTADPPAPTDTLGTARIPPKRSAP